MPKTAEEVKPNYGPVYAAAMYPELARICIENGYALAVHGSLARDFDVIAIPWVPEVSSHEKVLADIMARFAVELVGDIGQKEHGRVAYTLSIGWGSCSLDFSFMPAKLPHIEEYLAKVVASIHPDENFRGEATKPPLGELRILDKEELER